MTRMPWLCSWRSFPSRRLLISAVLHVLLVSPVALAQAPDCAGLEAACWQRCEDARHLAAHLNCRGEDGTGDGYSGCAADVAGCAGRVCSWIFGEPWCTMPGYLDCASGLMDAHIACIEGRNAAARATTTWGEKLAELGRTGELCHEPTSVAIVACRAQSCDAHCRQQGAGGGSYNHGSGQCTCSDRPQPPPSTNRPPVAHAGADQTVREGQLVVLDGSASHDPDGRIDLYAWRWGDGGLALGAVTQPRAFPPGVQVVTLVVQDNHGATGQDTVTITVLANQPPADDCLATCRSVLGDAAVGFGTPPDCRCACADGFRENPATGHCEAFSCSTHCVDAYGENATGEGVFPYCHCDCEPPFTPDNERRTCVLDCDFDCWERFGENVVGTGRHPDCVCACDEEAGFRWNPDKTACIATCNQDGRCDQDAGENCRNCADDCPCNVDPFTACNPNPAIPVWGGQWEDNRGCYVPDPEGYMRRSCEEMRKEVAVARGAFVTMHDWQSKNSTAVIHLNYNPADPFIGLHTDAGKWLVKLGLIDSFGKPNPYVQINPLRMMLHRLDSILTMCDRVCDAGAREPCQAVDALGAVRRAVDAAVTYVWGPSPSGGAPGLRGQTVTGSGSTVIVNPGAHIYSPGGIKHVVLPNGVAVFESEFFIDVRLDGSATIHLIEGAATYRGVDGQAPIALSSGEAVTVDARGRPSFVSRFDARAVERWWDAAFPEPGADVVIEVPGRYHGHLERGATDTIALKLAQPATIAIALRSTDFDTVLELYDAADRLVGANDDFDGTDSRLVADLAAGSYMVHVGSFWEDGRGAFALVVDEVEPPRQAHVRVDQPGQLTGYLSEGATDSYHVTLPRPATVTVELGSRVFDTYLEAYEGARLVDANDDFDGTDSRLVLDLPAGTYRFEVTSFYDWEGGDYSIRFAW